MCILCTSVGIGTPGHVCLCWGAPRLMKLCEQNPLESTTHKNRPIFRDCTRSDPQAPLRKARKSQPKAIETKRCILHSGKQPRMRSAVAYRFRREQRDVRWREQESGDRHRQPWKRNTSKPQRTKKNVH